MSFICAGDKSFRSLDLIRVHLIFYIILILNFFSYGCDYPLNETAFDV
jgi:hypothetical protein